MIKMRWTGIDALERSTLRVEKTMKKKADGLTDFVADAIISNIRHGWTTPGPSVKGQRPAVKTGNLDESIRKDRVGRDPKGRFAKEGDVSLVFVRIDTASGPKSDGRGHYEVVLEEALEREFMGPAVDEVAAMLPGVSKRKLS